MRRLPPVLLAVPALVLARLLPATGLGVGLRLAAATACLLIPGALISRAFRLRGLAPVVAWSLAALLFALAITFAVHSSLWLTPALLGVVAVLALPFAVRANDLDHKLDRVELAVVTAGIGFGIALWFVAVLDGDAFFHLARVRKLEVFGSLSLQNVGEFKDGSLHPGYAFPLWHGFLALIARLADVDPIAVGRNGPTILAPLQLALFYEAGRVLFRSASAGVAVVIAEVSLTGIAAGHGGSFTSLALPATASRQLLVPGLLALFFAHVRRPSAALFMATAAAAGTLALVHPTYALFVGVPLVGFAIARALLVGRELKPALTGIAALAVPTAIALAWLRPVVEATTLHNPSGQEVRRAFAQYPGQLTGNFDHYHVAARLFTRTGAVAVAALLCVPLAGFAARRRWAAWVLGGTLAIFALTLVPFVFPRFADAVSISQARRLVGFIPYPYALAGGASVLAGLLGIFVLPLALAAGIVLQYTYPGDFGYRFQGATPAWPTWVALVGGLAALLIGTFRRYKNRSDVGVHLHHEALAAAAVAVFAIPVAVHGFSHWTRVGSGSGALTRGLIKAVREDTKPKDVLFADPETGYLLAAYAPIYLADAPYGHVAVTKKNRPRERLRDAYRFYAHGGDLEIPRSYGARWIIVDHKRHRLTLDLPRAYADQRYVLYRLR
ncbi:MAG TPA: hypothetical protein VKD88_03040 [Gaiellaceae bacterium]|nr:hypothetical protein [Gaiellaceae bacterium]